MLRRKKTLTVVTEESIISSFFTSHQKRAIEHIETLRYLIAKYLDVNEKMKDLDKSSSLYWELKNKQVSYLSNCCMEIAGMVAKINASCQNKIVSMQNVSPKYGNLYAEEQWQYISKWLDLIQHKQVKQAIQICEERHFWKAV